MIYSGINFYNLPALAGCSTPELQRLLIFSAIDVFTTQGYTFTIFPLKRDALPLSYNGRYSIVRALLPILILKKELIHLIIERKTGLEPAT
jgi:hypothetical protein